MRYFVGSCNYKWTHARSNLEQLWVRREVGEELYKTVEDNNWTWTLLRSDSQSLPGDVYCRCDIFVDIEDDKHATHFILKFPQVKFIEKT